MPRRLARLLRAALGHYLGVAAFVYLGLSGILLVLAWQSGPQRAIDRAHDAALTARRTGRIVESWLAVEFDPRRMDEGRRWRAAARVSPCAVVEFQAEWGAPVRRAFCGHRVVFGETYTLPGMVTLAPRVPFAWARDASGFAVPEIRMSSEARAWLLGHPPDWTAAAGSDPTGTALAALRAELDRPVDAAIAGWSAPHPAFPLAFDPRHPAEALPLGVLEGRREGGIDGYLFAFSALLGLGLYGKGMTMLLGGRMPRLAFGFVAAVPLLALPYWGEQLPRALANFRSAGAGVLGEFLGDLDRTDRLVAGEPASATLASGERLLFPAGSGAYADTFGGLRFTPTQPDPADAEGALAALSTATAAQLRALPATDRADLFHRLTRDKTEGRRAAGFAFLAAAKEALLDPNGDEATRSAAKAFLAAWVTQPVEEVWPQDLGYRTRIRLLRDLTDLPVPEIANPARWIAERGEERAKPQPALHPQGG
jgi:hypothetical protein